ncbi:MAG: hypothetical protein JWN48_1605 [Myxococcaceae bacterium]|nr:hypothetical protein [Myxococcaceae bacterium]
MQHVTGTSKHSQSTRSGSGESGPLTPGGSGALGGHRWHGPGPGEAEAPRVYRGSRFADVWRAVAADPYDALPDRRLRLGSVRTLVQKNLYGASRRTLTSREDLLPTFDKLVHPAGICLRGTWSIDETTPYTGLFKSGSRGLIIARASDAMGEYRPGKLRFMGLAGKLYPTSDPEHATPLHTANFFVLENLSGSHTPHFVAARLSNDLLPVTPHAGVLSKVHLGAIAAPAFSLADRAWSPLQPMIRQLYPIAELGETDRDDAVSPVVMHLAALPNSRRVDTPDLRQELDLQYHPDGLRFELQVADHRSYLFSTGFRRIGEIHFTQSVASYSGDHRLHFAHPPYRHFRQG